MYVKGGGGGGSTTPGGAVAQRALPTQGCGKETGRGWRCHLAMPPVAPPRGTHRQNPRAAERRRPRPSPTRRNSRVASAPPMAASPTRGAAGRRARATAAACARAAASTARRPAPLPPLAGPRRRPPTPSPKPAVRYARGTRRAGVWAALAKRACVAPGLATAQTTAAPRPPSVHPPQRHTAHPPTRCPPLVGTGGAMHPLGKRQR